MKLGNIKIGIQHKPFIIAEMSGNHNHSLKRALAIVDAAAKSGADALKLQTYTADTMTLDLESGDFLITDKKNLWHGTSLHKLYEQAYTPWEWHKPIMDRCKKLGLLCFSTPFDESAVDFLESLNVPFYKIASFENNYIPMIRKIAKLGKPIIMSTGMATLSDLELAVNTIRKCDNNQIILLKCTSSYPASPEESNIATIPHMRQLFGCEVGLSDHTMGIGVAIASIAVGATVIEKHFTLARKDGGVDSTFSIEPEEMRSLAVETERAWLSLGNIKYDLTEKEKTSLIFRRSLYIAKDMKAGDIFTSENLRIVRPGYALEPKFYDYFLGKSVPISVKKGTPLTWDLLLGK